MASNLPCFSHQQLESICRVLGDTANGFSGTEIGHLLANKGFDDPTPQLTKWQRLFNALAALQNRHGVGNHIVQFINAAMNPSLYLHQPDAFSWRRENLNAALALCGYHVREDGQVGYAQKASTLDEALARANRLKSALEQRGVHPNVLAFCSRELLQENYFHAVFEAVKSVRKRLEQLSGGDADGAELVDFALGMSAGNPRVAINALQSKTEIGEQRGFSNLLKGIFGMVRNPLAHNAKIEWDMGKQDALDILTMLSLVHRKLDAARTLATG
ncbi:TIGR02391 family protein [Ralstonia pseudosolanacearum]|uniref:TIGR02391 family protein n=1 Tax=Ralstonia pseudosolanacearum TaxID=1310165 RepID=UPI0026747ACF|nr:TIGR02391 family protein [Ralstonia pseudosolanacearum]MDO3529587.1 TIGR02391 family protein [Ralstonia pseudosolanacearum]MDO3533858.1 TIGR02391 family protein [Ralstonia pseudosolanacearum]